ncbi:general odorant-binding protein 83a-like isoform X2 [Macrosteles quadrilineatus]|nr:general odorant-binding protein 83a-like isoform X2 [Macrosteles quadrilineatus]
MTEEQMKMAEMLHNNCVKETGVSEDSFSAAAKGDFKEDDSLKCYMKCLLVQMGVFSEEDMSLDKEAMIEMVPDEVKEQSTKAVEKCTPLHGENGCEMAFNLYKCFYAFDPEKYFLI